MRLRPGRDSSRVSEAPPGHSELALYRFLIHQARPYWGNLAGVLLLSLLVAPLALLTPVPLKIAIDSGLGRHPTPGVLQPVLGDGSSRTRVLLGAAALLVSVALLTQLQSMALALLRASTGEQL